MAIASIDEVMLREPRLLVPGLQPLGPVKIDWTNPITKDLIWFSFPAYSRNNFSSTKGIVSLVDGTEANPNDANYYGKYAIVNGIPTLAWYAAASVYEAGKQIATLPKLSGATNLSLAVGVNRQASDIDAQSMNFRIDTGITLDIFSITSTSTTWGTDWFAAWNGSSQQTLNVGLGEIHLAATLTPATGRLFHNRTLAGTKSGSGSGSVSSSTLIIHWGTHNARTYSALWVRALTDAEMISFQSNPYQFLIPA